MSNLTNDVEDADKHIPSMTRSVVAAAVLSVVALPVVFPSPANAADVVGPATCYLADENDAIIEPRQEYVPHEGAGTVPVQPSPIVPGEYTLEVNAPALNFDPDRPDMHFVCQVFYSPLGNVRLIDVDGTVLAMQRYANDQNDPSRAAVTALPTLPEGYEIIPDQTVRGFDPAAGTVDPNDPANARAVGADTDILIRKITAQTTPEPTPSTPSTPATPAPQPSVTPTPQTPAVVTHSAPETPVPGTPTPSSGLARTGSDASALVAVGVLLAGLGAGVIAIRKARA